MFLRERVKDGAYDPMTSAQAFAKTLTADLRSVNHDLHFEVTYSVAAPDPRAQTLGILGTSRRRGKLDKFLTPSGFMNFPKCCATYGDFSMQIHGFS